VLELARKLGVKNAEKSSVELVPMPKENADDPKVRKPDISKAKRVLGWEPTVPRAQGFAETISYFVETSSR